MLIKYLTVQLSIMNIWASTEHFQEGGHEGERRKHYIINITGC